MNKIYFLNTSAPVSTPSKPISTNPSPRMANVLSIEDAIPQRIKKNPVATIEIATPVINNFFLSFSIYSSIELSIPLLLSVSPKPWTIEFEKPPRKSIILCCNLHHPSITVLRFVFFLTTICNIFPLAN